LSVAELTTPPNNCQKQTARVFIYTLADPVTREVRYVGKAINLQKRLRKHVYDSTGGHEQGHKANWIKSLRAQGLKPIIEALEEIVEPTDEQWQEAERFWIEYLRVLGFKLTNLVAGGFGCLNASPATRAKLRNNFKGRTHTPETRARMSASAKVVNSDKDHRARISATKKGYKHTPEAVRKIKLMAINRHKDKKQLSLL